jgi:hypothetical protein
VPALNEKGVSVAPSRFIAQAGIEQADWDEFRTSDGLLTAQNGGTFLDPLYWRTSNTLNDPDRVDELFLKMQTFVEQFTEANQGKAFYTGLKGLGQMIFEDYEKNKKRNIR